MIEIPRFTITPIEGCDEGVGRWLSALADTRWRTVAALEELHTVDLDAEPVIGKNTIGTILYHMAATDLVHGYLRTRGVAVPEELQRDFPTLELDTEGRLYRPSGLVLNDYRDLLDLARQHVVGIFQPMSREQLRTPIRCTADFGVYEATPEAVLNHLMQHEAEHRGQIAILARAQCE